MSNTPPKKKKPLYKEISSLERYFGFAFFRNQMTKKTLIGRYMYVIIAAFLLTFSFDYFIFPSGAYNGGLSGFCQIFVRLKYPTSTTMSGADLKNSLMFYWILYFSLNIPLIIFGFLKIGKQFTILSISLIVFQNIFHYVLIAIPEVSHFVFMNNVHTQERILWEFLTTLAGGIIYGIGIAFAFLAGGSSGGSDFLTTYFSIKKDKPIGYIMKFVNLGILFLAVLLDHVIRAHENFFFVIFQERFVLMSMFLIIAVTLTVDQLYPRYKKLSLSITSKKADLIIRSLILKGYPHGFANIDILGGFSQKTTNLVKTTLTLMEYKAVIAHIKRVDPNCFIVVEKVHSVIGRYRIPKN